MPRRNDYRFYLSAAKIRDKLIFVPGDQIGYSNTKNTKSTKMYHALPPETEAIGRHAIDAGLRVHAALGAGLLESAYEHCLAHELVLRGLDIRRQVALPVIYDGTTLDAGYRIDLLVGAAVVIEIKCVDALGPIRQAQLLTYLRLSRCRLGFLMNFKVCLFKDGLRRMVV